MLSRYELTMEQRDAIWSTLTEQQQHFLHHILVRGRRTRFARQLARMKFQFIPEEVTLKELEAIIDEWDYIGFIDSGAVNPNTKCECGRALRYQHEVLHVPTNSRKYFGIEHLQLHTGIDAQAVQAIMKGFDVLDMEMNELLCKHHDGWKLAEHLFLPLPEAFEMPQDIQEHLDADMPLLDRQLQRIRGKLNELEKQSRMVKMNKIIEAQRQSSGNEDSRDGSLFLDVQQMRQLDDVQHEQQELQSSFSFSLPEDMAPITVMDAGQGQFLFDFDLEEPILPEAIPSTNNLASSSNSHSSGKGPFYLPSEAERIIREALPVGRVSVLSVSEFLIERGILGDTRFSTGKPHSYIAVAAYLDKLCFSGECELFESSPEDRVYAVTRPARNVNFGKY